MTSLSGEPFWIAESNLYRLVQTAMKKSYNINVQSLTYTVFTKNNSLCCPASAGYYLVKHSPILIIFVRHIAEGCWIKSDAFNSHLTLLLSVKNY